MIQLMISLSHILYGLVAIALGIVMLRFNYQMVNMTGRQDWIESKLGSGSTYLAYKIFALAIIFFGILLIIGLGGSFFNWLFSPLRGLFTPPGR